MKISKQILYFLSIPLFYFFLVKIDTSTLLEIADEDALIENIGALSFFAASLIFGYLFLQSKGSSHKFLQWTTDRNIYFGLLAIFFLVVFGEEISWGQRIFGWETPETLGTLNRQNETNLHNLWLFDDKHFDGTKKNFWGVLFSMNRMFSIFWLIFCLIIPILYSYSSKAKSIIQNIGLPVGPIWIGLLFMLNYITFKVAINVGYPAGETHPYQAYIDEGKETIYALIFLLLAFDFWIKSRSWQKAKAVLA